MSLLAAYWHEGLTLDRPFEGDVTHGAGAMRVIVTGAGGFVGRELVSRLLNHGHSVTAIDVHAASIPPAATPVAGDLGDAGLRAKALERGCDALIHLATIPGGAAEADPSESRRINIDAMYDLLTEAGIAAPGLRVIYASSIAVFGEPLPEQVDDNTPLSPRMIYGGHKAMMELAVAMLSNRGQIDGMSLRLPGILARPKGPSGMKSAFMSDLFHALKAGQPFTCPVSATGTVWAQSVGQCADNFITGLTADTTLLPPGRAVTLPALRLTMADLAAEIARQCGVDAELVSYRPDADLEAAFAKQPPLATLAAEQAGFAHDGDLAMLVTRALETLG